jgi:hypothetical protein
LDSNLGFVGLKSSIHLVWLCLERYFRPIPHPLMMIVFSETTVRSMVKATPEDALSLRTICCTPTEIAISNLQSHVITVFYRAICKQGSVASRTHLAIAVRRWYLERFHSSGKTGGW